MKFWQKAFFLTLVLFLIAFDVLGYTLLERSFSLNRENALQAAQAEQRVITRSVSESIDYSSSLYTELNEENLKGMIAPYASYYEEQGGSFALFLDGRIVFNSNAGFSPPAARGAEARTETVGDALYCIVGSDLPSPLEDLRLVYMKNATFLLDFKGDMTRSFIIINVIISLLLMGALLLLLVRLTGPFRSLNAAALAIAQGDYAGRAPARGNDEIGQFARSFNMMADKVQEHVEELSALNESKERFIGNLSHELRTPITAITGYAELLKIGNIGAGERARSVDYIIGQSRRIQNMAHKLNELTGIGRSGAYKEEVDLGAVLSNVCATCKAQLEEKHIAVRRDVEGAAVSGDAELIESLLQNLIENAVRASADGGEIDIRAASEDGGTVVTVTDRGRGMEAQELSKVTEPFYRVDKGRARADGGVGLGLAICARICELHGARLEIESNAAPGAGGGHEAENENEAEAGYECESGTEAASEAGMGTKVTLHFTSP